MAWWTRKDLPLNVARESIQATRPDQAYWAVDPGQILAELEDLASTNAERYQAFWQAFGVFIKEGVATEPEDAERLAKLLRFHSSTSDGTTPTVTLDDYVARMKPDQEHIYYILVDDLKTAKHSPHLDTFRAHDLEVLYLADTVDSFMLLNLPDYEGKPLRNVDDAGLELPNWMKPQSRTRSR